jgi:hypothetical protein
MKQRWWYLWSALIKQPQRWFCLCISKWEAGSLCARGGPLQQGKPLSVNSEWLSEMRMCYWNIAAIECLTCCKMKFCMDHDFLSQSLIQVSFVTYLLHLTVLTKRMRSFTCRGSVLNCIEIILKTWTHLLNQALSFRSDNCFSKQQWFKEKCRLLGCNAIWLFLKTKVSEEIIASIIRVRLGELGNN